VLGLNFLEILAAFIPLDILLLSGFKEIAEVTLISPRLAKGNVSI